MKQSGVDEDLCSALTGLSLKNKHVSVPWGLQLVNEIVCLDDEKKNAISGLLAYLEQHGDHLDEKSYAILNSILAVRKNSPQHFKSLVSVILGILPNKKKAISYVQALSIKKDNPLTVRKVQTTPR